MRYFFHIGYKGTFYKGWQRHPNGISVQQVLESALQQILKMPVNIVGCGRTDAGVHASQFFFHLDVPQAWAFDMLFRLNKVLPPDIAVFDIIPMDGLPHARFDATARSYDYYIHTYKDPFLSEVSSLYLLQSIDLGRMQDAATLLLQYTDYRNFCLTPADHDSTLCRVTEAQWFATPNADRLRFRVSANRFLSRMIRIVTGKLLQVGSGTLSLDAFESYLALEAKPKHLSPAYPQGLFLSKVSYPYLNLPARTSFAASVQQLPQNDWLVV